MMLEDLISYVFLGLIFLVLVAACKNGAGREGRR